MDGISRILFVEPSASDTKLVSKILLKMTDPLPGRYVFDVVENNSAALEKASRTAYRSVWVAEEQGSTLDGRLAVDVLRASCPGLAVILLLDDVQQERQKFVKKEASTARRSSSFDKHERSRCGPTTIGKRASLRPRGQQGGGGGGRGNESSAPKGSAVSHQALLSRMGSGSRVGPSGTARSGLTGQENSAPVKLSAADYVMKKPFSEESFRLLVGAVRAEKSQVSKPLGRMKASGKPEQSDNALSFESLRLGNGERTGKSTAVAKKPETYAEKNEVTKTLTATAAAVAAATAGGMGNNTMISLLNCRKGLSHVGQDQLQPQTPSSSDELWLPVDVQEAELEAEDVDRKGCRSRGNDKAKDEGEMNGDLPMLPESPLLPPAPKERPPRVPRAMKPARSALQVGALTVPTYTPQPPLARKHPLLEMMPGLPSVPTAYSAAESFVTPIHHMSSWGRAPSWYTHPMVLAVGADPLQQQQQHHTLAQPSPDGLSLSGSRHNDYIGGNSIIRQQWPGTLQFQASGTIAESAHQAVQSASKRARLTPASSLAAAAAAAAVAAAAVVAPPSYGFISTTPAASAPAHLTRGTVSAGRSRKGHAVSSSSGRAAGADAAAGTRLALGTSGTAVTWTSPQLHPAGHDGVSNSSQQTGDVLRSTLGLQAGAVAETVLPEATCGGSSPFSSVAAAISVPQRSTAAAGEVSVNGSAHGGTDAARSSAMTLVYDSEETILEADAWPSPSVLGGNESGSGGGDVNTHRASGMTPLLHQGGSAPPSTPSPQRRDSFLPESGMSTPTAVLPSATSLLDRGRTTQSPLSLGGCKRMRA